MPKQKEILLSVNARTIADIEVVRVALASHIEHMRRGGLIDDYGDLNVFDLNIVHSVALEEPTIEIVQEPEVPSKA